MYEAGDIDTHLVGMMNCIACLGTCLRLRIGGKDSILATSNRAECGAYNCVLCISEQGCSGHCIWNLINMHEG